jgi:hypothetical protein
MCFEYAMPIIGLGRLKNPLRRKRTQPPNLKMKILEVGETELKGEEDTLELEDSPEEGGELLLEEEVEGTLGEAAIEAEDGEEEATELGDTEQGGDCDSLHFYS